MTRGIAVQFCLLLNIFGAQMTTKKITVNGRLHATDRNGIEVAQLAFFQVYNMSTCFQNSASGQNIVFDVTSGQINNQQSSQSMPGTCDLLFSLSPEMAVSFQVETCEAIHSRLVDLNVSFTRNNELGTHCTLNTSYPMIYRIKDRIFIEESPRYDPVLIVGLSNLSARFVTVRASEKSPHLELIDLTSSSGYLQSSGWNGSSRYPPYSQDCIMFTVPTDYILFFSFLSLKKDRADTLDGYLGQCDSTRFVTVMGGSLRGYEPFLFPDKYMTRKRNQDLYMSIRFISGGNRNRETGFKLRFSFHGETLKPKRVAKLLPGEMSQRWNCCEAVWPGLHQHFPCDLNPQCAESEDEASCPYMTEKCGLNRITIGGGCYSFVPDSRLSWLEAGRNCRAAGGQLVSMERRQEYRDVVSLIRPFTQGTVWTGLTSTRFGAKKASLNTMYRNTLHWESGSVVFSLQDVSEWGDQPCGLLFDMGNSFRFRFQLCNKRLTAVTLCEFPPASDPPASISASTSPPRLPSLNATLDKPRVPLIACPLQHLTQELLYCDEESLCQGLEGRGGGGGGGGRGWSGADCRGGAPSGLVQPYFACGVLEQFVPYTLVCDFRVDCAGGNDEDFCVHPACQGNTMQCGKGQCVDIARYCNGYQDCMTNLDEANCVAGYHVISSLSLPAVVNFDQPGGFTLTPLPPNTSQCPDTHFQCQDEGLCLPVYVLCNEVNDCPGHEDEAECQRYSCPGFYRCRGRDTTLCVHMDHLCDGMQQCPEGDDELMCNTTACPQSCMCSGLAFTCVDRFLVRSVPQLRYLEARHSGLGQSEVAHNTMLIHLGVEACGWRELKDMMLPNLHSLDLSNNFLRSVNFSLLSVGMPHLQRLNVSGNPVTGSLSGTPPEVQLLSMKSFYFSGVEVTVLNLSALSAVMPNLELLNLSGSKTLSLRGRRIFKSLRVLDMKNCSVGDFAPDFMKSMASLTYISAENHHFCCSAVLPDHFTGECFAPSDEISSCEDLLKSAAYRCALAVFAVLALLGNCSSFVYRLFVSKERTRTGFSTFALHLCFSDFLMGVYLGIIGVADIVYFGTYLWNEVKWKSSAVCSLAGFLSLLSSEVSAFVICLITFDRFLVLRFPFSQIRFGARSANTACGVLWTLGLVLAMIPLLPVTSHWAFYQQTGICIPLPVTRAEFAGHTYSFSVMIICNLALFLLIAVGQALIYWSVTSNTLNKKSEIKDKSHDGTKSKEAIIARRLLTIAMSDFLCWFPIGLCGLLAANGILIPGEVNVAMAIFILPLNSAINPFLYTLNVILEKRQRNQERRLLQILRAQQKS